MRLTGVTQSPMSAWGVYGGGDSLCGKDSGKIEMVVVDGEVETGGSNNRDDQ